VGNVLDPQKKRVYAWEGEWADWNSHTISVTKVRKYVRWACDLYGLPYPSVKMHRTQEYSYSWGYKMSFAEGQCNRAIALHEAAHYISDWIFDENMAPHSPQWMAIYLWLLIKARIAPKVALFASATSKGIEWIPLWQVSPKRLSRQPRYRPFKYRERPPSR
jgi:hypothetical protein